MTDDPSVRRSTRAVLAIGILVGLTLAVETALSTPEQVGLASTVYYYAGEAILTGENVYTVTPPDYDGYNYLYPPIVVLAFLPHALLGSETAAFALQTILNVAAGTGIAIVVWRGLARRGVSLERVDYALVLGFTLLSSHAITQVIQGQVTLWLAFLLAAGFDALEREREREREAVAGAAFALAALVKLFPAVIGLWLVRRRAWRGVAAAVATGCGGLLAGLVLFGPDLTIQYVTEVLTGRFQESTFDGVPDPDRSLVTVRRLFAALGVGPTLLTPLALATLAPFVAALYRRVDTDERRLAALLGTLVATLLFMPLQPLYFSLLAFPLLVLLYRLPAGRSRRLFVAGVYCTYAMFSLEMVVVAVGVVPLPAGLEAAVLSVAETVFTAILPPTVGMWLLLFACVSICYDGETAAHRVPSPAD
ncbi:glycosyltransferase 87 family protein [Halomontanus rarus]|uniref:glycosyltransferase 87 family protein n=1 Tax=Halomontanus rarus TaxID=3034020 RepID=UPI001A98D3BC